MPQITRVKKAQQRYVMVPVLDKEGRPVRHPVMRQDGTQRTDKNGQLVFRAWTVPDTSQPPLPPHTCDRCGKTIEIGSPYKHMTPKSGPYGGVTLYRCGPCPDWKPWEYSNSLSARLMQISDQFATDLSAAENEDDVQSALSAAAEAAQEIAEQKREAAQNIEEGFGHPTSQSEELNNQADQLEDWAIEIESSSIPDYPEPEDGAGEPSDEQIDGWRDALEDELTIVDESPL